MLGSYLAELATFIWLGGVWGRSASYAVNPDVPGIYLAWTCTAPVAGQRGPADSPDSAESSVSRAAHKCRSTNKLACLPMLLLGAGNGCQP